MSEKSKNYEEIEPVWSRYMHAKASALGIPLSGTFELTTRCNFDCKMCYVHDNSRPDALTAQEWLQMADEARNRGMLLVLLTGGEPLIRKDFKEIYAGMKQMGLLMQINTNAALMDDDMIDFLSKDPPLRINVTLYGGSDDTYRRLCGRPAFGKVVENLRKMKDAGLQVRVNASITPYNAEDVEEIFRICFDMDLAVKSTAYMFPPVRNNGEQFGDSTHRSSPEEAAAYQLKCREQYLGPEQLAAYCYGEMPMDLMDDCVDGQGEHVTCRAGSSAFWVTWDGRMLPCGMFSNEGYPIREMGFAKAWESVREFRNALRMPAACTDCPEKKRCTVCAASAFCETGDLTKRPSYICRMTHELHRLTADKYLQKEINHEDQ